MELSDFVSTTMLFTAALPIGAYIGVNIFTYKHTKKMINESKRNFSENELYENFNDGSFRGYLTYFLGYPGIKIANLSSK